MRLQNVNEKGKGPQPWGATSHYAGEENEAQRVDKSYFSSVPWLLSEPGLEAGL